MPDQSYFRNDPAQPHQQSVPLQPGATAQAGAASPQSATAQAGAASPQSTTAQMGAAPAPATGATAFRGATAQAGATAQTGATASGGATTQASTSFPRQAAPAPATGAYANANSLHPQVPEPKKTRWWIPLLIILALLFFIGLMFSTCVASLGSLSGLGYGNSFQDNTVAVIEMGGTIQYDGTANSPEGFKTLLDTANKDDNVKAIVLRVNSGGGIAAAGEEMSTYLQQFDKPVVVSSAAINASAAYMISAQSDYIYVLNSTDIGSIGTIMQHYDLSELLEKLGINIENIKSADSKDSSYYNRPLTEEERAEYQHQVDVINDNFIRMVSEGRNMSIEEVRKLSDGTTKVGQESVDAGLADGIGTFDDACKKAAELANLGDDYHVDTLRLYYNDISDLMGLLGSSGESSSRQALLKLVEELESNDRTIH